MDDKKQSVLNKIIRLVDRDKEFAEALKSKLGVSATAVPLSLDGNRIDEIYEYCIEQVIRKQAKEFYEDFPLPDIKQSLEEDFFRMESFRRKDNFGDFCLALYQQIECITNKICESQELSIITDKLWGYPAYVKQGKEMSIADRVDSEYTIASLVFPGFNKNTGIQHAFTKSHNALQNQFANDKIRIIVYFLGYKCMMRNSDYESYVEITSLFSDLYQCRNTNHRGNTMTEWETNTLNKILPLKSLYYFKFQGALAQYVEFVKSGLASLNSIRAFCDTIEHKKVNVSLGVKIVGKIQLEPDKRFR